MVEKAQVVVEEAIRHALEAGRRAAKQAAAGDQHAAGQVFAYHDLLELLLEQAELVGLDFAERALASVNPDELLQGAP